MPEKKRKLNMEEKHQLQKLIDADIEGAEREYAAARKEKRDALQERLLEKVGPEVVRHFADWKAAVAAKAKAIDALNALGYGVYEYGDAPKLQIGYGRGPREVIAFDAETSAAAAKFAALRRDFTLRLFAGGEEARALFETLASELARIR